MPAALFPTLADDALSARMALSFPDRSLTYGQLRGAAAAVASALAGHERVAVIAENRIETCIAVIGALTAGVPAVPLNPKSGSSELAHIVGDAAPDALLVAPGASVPEALADLRRIEVDADAARCGA